LGNAAIIYSTPAGTYPDTNSSFYTSISVSCIRGTYRNYTGIEVCTPCPNGTYSSDYLPCTPQDSFCPYGAVEEVSYSMFESIEQDQDYPESPKNTAFDDLLMQNIFTFNTRSIHCLLVSPITWIFLVVGLGVTIVVGMTMHEACGPDANTRLNLVKRILRKVDLIGEGEVTQLSVNIIYPFK
jgi:hypothetical protein